MNPFQISTACNGQAKQICFCLSFLPYLIFMFSGEYWVWGHSFKLKPSLEMTETEASNLIPRYKGFLWNELGV